MLFIISIHRVSEPQYMFLRQYFVENESLDKEKIIYEEEDSEKKNTYKDKKE